MRHAFTNPLSKTWYTFSIVILTLAPFPDSSCAMTCSNPVHPSSNSSRTWSSERTASLANSTPTRPKCRKTDREKSLAHFPGGSGEVHWERLSLTRRPFEGQKTMKMSPALFPIQSAVRGGRRQRNLTKISSKHRRIHGPADGVRSGVIRHLQKRDRGGSVSRKSAPEAPFGTPERNRIDRERGCVPLMEIRK